MTAFHVYFQPTEGKLWNRLYRDGLPLRLPALISRAEFVEEVGNREGAYQLQPIDAQGKPIGDPPSMVFLGTSREPVALSVGMEPRSDTATGAGAPAALAADAEVVAPDSPPLD